MIEKSENRDDIMKLIREGNRTPRSLAEEFNIPIQTIYTWIRRERRNLAKLEREDDTNVNAFSWKAQIDKDVAAYKSRIQELEEKNKLLEDSLRNLNNYLNLLKEKYEK